MPKALEFAVDASAAPAGVISVEVQDELTELAGFAGRPVPGFGDCVLWRATRCRCQPVSVLGLTINITDPSR